jgi:hypothetical protein
VHRAASPADQLAKDMARYGAHHARRYVCSIGDQSDAWCNQHQTIRAAMGFAEHHQLTERLIARYPVSRPVQQVRKRASA